MLKTPPVHVLVGGDEQKVVFLNCSNGLPQHEIHLNLKIFKLCQIDDDQFACTGYERSVSILSHSGRAVVKTLGGFTNNTKGIAFEPTNQILIAGDQGNEIRLFGMKPEWEPRGCLRGHDGTVYGVTTCSGPFPEFCWSGSYDNTVRKWDMERQLEVGPRGTHSNDVEAVASSSEKKLIFSGGDDQKAMIWDASSMAKVGEVTVHSSVYSLCYRALQQQLLVGSNDGSITVYDLRKLAVTPGSQDVIRKITGHAGGDMWSLFDFMEPDLFGSTSWGDESVKVWDTTGKCHWTYNSPKDVTGAIAFRQPYSDWVQVTLGKSLGDPMEEFLVSEDCLSRVEFLVERMPEEDEGMSDFSLILSCGSGQVETFRLLKSLLADSVDFQRYCEVDEVKVVVEGVHMLCLSQEVLVSFLLGTQSIPDLCLKETESLIDLYLVLRALKMKNHVWHICDAIAASEFLPSEVLSFLTAVHTRFSDVGAGSRCLLYRVAIDRLRKEKEYLRRNSTSFVDLLKSPPVVIETHPEVGAIEGQEPKSAVQLRVEALKRLIVDKLGASLRLRSAVDGGIVRVHLDQLLVAYEYFLAMFRFAGAEFESFKRCGEISIDGLTTEALELLVRYAYTRSLIVQSDAESDDLEDLLQLESWDGETVDLREPTLLHSYCGLYRVSCVMAAGDLAQAALTGLKKLDTRGPKFLQIVSDGWKVLRDFDPLPEVVKAWESQGHHTEVAILEAFADGPKHEKVAGLEAQVSSLTELIQTLLERLEVLERRREGGK